MNTQTDFVISLLCVSCVCSAGVGRTGSFMAIDSMLDRSLDLDTVDVFGYVTVLRTQRMHMVQTPVCGLGVWSIYASLIGS